MMILRTQEEIVAHLKNIEGDCGLFDFRPEVLIRYLDYDHARSYLKDEVTQDEWEGEDARLPLREKVLADMAEYMDFAWEKALDERGLSAMRSIQKIQAWLWLLQDEELLSVADDDNAYPPYDKPILRQVSEKYGFPIPDA